VDSTRRESIYAQGVTDDGDKSDSLQTEVMRDRRGEKGNFIADLERHPGRYSAAIEDLRGSIAASILGASRQEREKERERERQRELFSAHRHPREQYRPPQSGQSRFKFRGGPYIDPTRDYMRDSSTSCRG